MYKSSGKKYTKGTRDTQGGKYRASSSGYASDVYRTDDDDEYDENEYVYGGNSPDYYFTGSGHHGKSSASSYNTHHQPGGHGHSKSNLNYYSGNSKSHDRYYSSYDTISSSHGKHKGGKEPAYKLNKYQTVVLKVQIHCDACIRKVKKAIAEIDGVESINVDQKQKKVSVTGYIDPKKVVKKVAKTGKSVELVGGGTVGKDDHVNMLSNKAALIMAASDHHRQHHQHPAMLTGVKPYTVQVEKNSRTNNVHVPQYIHMTPQVRSDMDYMFSDDNTNSCSIM